MSVGLGGWRPANHHALCHRRRGSIYVMVLGTSLVVTVIGLSALTMTRIERRSAESTGDFAQARLYAQAAIDIGLLRIRNDPNWRTTYTNGDWEIRRVIGSGTYTVGGYDPVDGILDDGSSDPLILKGVGFEGAARYQLQVQLEAQGQALTCLEVALHAGNDLSFDAAIVSCNQIISANDNVDAVFSNVVSNVEAVNTISGSTYTGLRTLGITPRTMPDGTVFDDYVTTGTTISFADIPNAQGKKTIQEVVISPSNNPYPPGGPTDTDGIYVIDCQGANLRIRNARIVGTLVILNPGTFSIEQSVNWNPALANYPSLLVNGSAGLHFTNTALDEASLGVDFNEDGDTLDSYPSRISGLVYVSNDVTTQNYVTIDGVMVIGTTLTATDDLNLTYRQTYLDNPPPGFGEPTRMVVSPGTWRQIVD